MYGIMKELTDIQEKILQFITLKINEGIPPSLAEIADHFGLKNRSTIQQHLEAIEKKGYLMREKSKSRSIRLINEVSTFNKKPVIGEVAAGNPLKVYEGIIDFIDLPGIVRYPKDSFILKVKGNSLTDAQIFDGDFIIINPNINPINGKIIVAIIDDTAVVKRFEKKGSKIYLHSENPDYKPIIIEEKYHNLKIVGVVVGVYRNLY